MITNIVTNIIRHTKIAVSSLFAIGTIATFTKPSNDTVDMIARKNTEYGTGNHIIDQIVKYEKTITFERRIRNMFFCKFASYNLDGFGWIRFGYIGAFGHWFSFNWLLLLAFIPCYLTHDGHIVYDPRKYQHYKRITFSD